MQKCQIAIFYLTPSGRASLGVPHHLRETSDLKITRSQTFLEFNFSKGLFRDGNPLFSDTPNFGVP